jgi:HTH-type transcriptional regulator/antitoxin HigA
MTTTRHAEPSGLPRAFDELVRLLPPRAISDDAQSEEVRAMVDRLMAAGRLTRDQRDYLETLVQLVEAYEAEHHAIESGGLTGLDSLRHMMAEHGMSASALARLLGVHVSMGSKILKGERSLTVGHVKALAAHFGVSPVLFLD